MRLVLRVLLCWLVVQICQTLEISHQDLEDPNGNLCGPSGWCDENTNSTDDLRTRNCMCDEKCDKYGDCCLNSAHFNAAQQRRAASSFLCAAIEDGAGSGYAYTKVECPPQWRNTEVRRKCEKSAQHSVDDPLLMTPVTSASSNVTYGNVYCAVCNRDYDNRNGGVTYWMLKLDCRDQNGLSLPSEYDGQSYQSYVEQNLSFNNRLDYWQVRDKQGVYYKCDLLPSIPAPMMQLVRRCRPTVKTCPATWGKDEIRQRCESYTLMVHRNATPLSSSSSSASASFRNVHCAICNSVPVQSVGCQSGSESRSEIGFRFDSFTILFDFNGGRNVGELVNCSGSGGGGGSGNSDTRPVYDSFFRRCRNIETGSSSAAEESNDGDGDSDTDRTLRRSLNCSKVIFDATEFRLMNDSAGSVYLPKYDKTFEPGKYVYVNHHHGDGDGDGTAVTLEVCKEYYAAATDATAGAGGGGGGGGGDERRRITYRPYYSLITMIGIGVSVICLCVHLIVFAAVKELRNLSGKNLASFCLALLLAYCSFAMGDLLDGRLCLANAICTYYLFMVAFTWMLIMSFDVWRTLRIATKELRVSSGKQWRKFMVYSCCSWVLPAKIALIAVLVDLCPTSLVSDAFRPHFGQRSCWFGQGPPMLVFFGLPVFAILVCNLVFFLSSAYMIYSSHSMTRYSASPATKRDFRLYARLALIMGLTWISGLLAAFVNSEILWVVFILSNTSLGLFVFVAFTCRSKVLRALKNLKRDSVLNLPAFSWSMNASEVDGKSHIRSSSSSAADSVSEKPTSNTYY
ncbi:uncharacterized protein LOC135838694 [Planococcus citri]|uniref:uncharacterized protein LOC135838694 n=1 Tax=Planococcus citri TaxID=170843 RepID=UPI0031F9EF35